MTKATFRALTGVVFVLLAASSVMAVSPLPPYDFWPCNPSSTAPKAFACTVPDPYNCYNYRAYTTREALQFKVGSGKSSLDTGSPNSYGNCPGVDQFCQLTPKINSATATVVQNAAGSRDFLFDIQYEFPNNYCQVDDEGPPCNAGIWPPQFVIEIPAVRLVLVDADSGNEIYTVPAVYETGRWTPRVNAGCVATTRHFKIIATNLGGPYCGPNPTASVTIPASAAEPTVANCSNDNWCPSCGVNTPPAPYAGTPIGLGSGDMTYTERLFAIDQQPMALRFALTYHSNRPIYPALVNHPLGNGWTHTFNDTLRPVDPTHFVLYRDDGEGHETQYEGAPNGPWAVTSPGELRGRQLVTLSDGLYRISDTDGTVTTFSAATGAWQSTTDRWGNSITGLFDANGVLTGVRDSAGREIHFTISAGLINAITLPTGETWRLHYDGTSISAIFDPIHTGATAWRTYSYLADHAGTPRLLEGVHDESGAVLEGHAYDAQDRATTSYSGANRELVVVTYGANGRTHVTTTLDGGLAQESDFTLRYFAGRWLPTRIVGSCASCGASSDSEDFALDDDNRMTSRTDGSGHVTTYAYDAYGNRISETRAYGTAKARTTTYAYGYAPWPSFMTRMSEPSAARSGAVKVTTLSWNANESVLTRSESGYLSATDTAPTAYTSTTSFDSRHRPIAADGPRSDVNDVTQIAYYADDDAAAARRGRVHQTTDAAGLTTTSDDYDIFGNARTLVEPNGVTTTLETDGRGRITTSTNGAIASDPNESASYVSISVYDGRDRLVQQTMPRGNVLAYRYEEGTNRLTDTLRLDMSGNEVERHHVTLNDIGDKTTEEEQSCDTPAPVCSTWTTRRRESYSYDSHNRLSAVVHPVPAGSSSRYTYDADGKLKSVQDENHIAPNTRYAYDELDRLISVTQTLATAPGGVVVTRYGYDVMDNLAAVTDPNGNVTRYTYDDFRRMTSQASPVSGTTRYGYDPAGNLIAITDARLATTTRSYDALNRVLTATSTLGVSAETVSFTYDDPTAGNYGKGRVAAMQDPSGAKLYAYDRRGLLRVEEKTILGDAYTTRYQYDPNGNRSGITYPSQRQLAYAFDYADRPLSLTGTYNSTTTEYAGSAQYLPFGPESSLRYGDGTISRSAGYDLRYRLKAFNVSSGATKLADYAYGLDAVGNITAITDQLDARYNRAFAYDDLHRLTGADTGAALWGHGSYSYDSTGNRTGVTLGSRNSSYAYRTVDNATTSMLASVTESGTTRGVAYDAAGNETPVNGATFAYSARNYLDQGDGIRYVYDGTGLRVAQVGVSVGPLIIAQPQSKAVCPGSAAGLSVGASGASSYQWQQFDGTAWNDMAGATASSVLVTPAAPTQYRVIVANAAASTTSNPATVTPVALATEPASGILYGDVNHDGVVNGTDVAVLREVIAGLQSLAVPAAVADLNGDGAVDAVDLSLLNAFTTNTVPCLPRLETSSSSLASLELGRARTTQAAANPSQYFFYTPEKNLLSQTELRAAGGQPQIAVDYIWFNGHPVAEERPTQTRYTYSDHLGTPFLQTDTAFAPVWRIEYEPFGSAYELRTGTNPDQRLRFPGQEYDEQTPEREYNIFRWYRAGWGRYTQADPDGLEGGVNLFGYALENPIYYIDPTGLKSCSRCDQCPSGKWVFYGPAITYGGGFLKGTSVTTGTLVCRDEEWPSLLRAAIKVKVECSWKGVMAGIGVSLSGPVPPIPNSCGCNENEVLGESKGWTASLGPFSLDWGKCSGGGSSWGPGMGPSLGGGLARTKCKTYRNWVQ